MANTAMIELQDHLETLRREAYEEGYRAAMRAVTDFAAQPAQGQRQGKSRSAAAGATKPALPAQKQRQSRLSAAQKAPPATRRRFSRGDNAKHVAKAMSGLPDRTGKANDIRKALAGKGIDLAYTSIRHSLNQLQQRGEASVAGNGKTWTYSAPAKA